MLHISPLRDDTRAEFKRLFCDYYAELGCEDDCAHLLEEYILPDLLAGLIKIDVLRDSDRAAGFVIYQIDDVDNEWNFKEGWADVREIYVAPECRRTGAGRLLLYTAELKLKEAGANKSYALPTEAAAPFFEACGDRKTDDYNADLDCNVYVKQDLNNKCK